MGSWSNKMSVFKFRVRGKKTRRELSLRFTVVWSFMHKERYGTRNKGFGDPSLRHRVPPHFNWSLPTRTLCRTYRVTGYRRSPRVGLGHCWQNGARNPELKKHTGQCNNLQYFVKPTFSPPPMMETHPAALTTMFFAPGLCRHTDH